MIWSRGEILPDSALTIPATDRTFEHGLGLFETLRTWNSRAPFWPDHRSRMLGSAHDLKIPVDPADLPDDRAIRHFIETIGEDQILRITASGGSVGQGSVIWMRAKPLGDREASVPARIRLGPSTVLANDPMARHKTLNYWSRRLAMESARLEGFDEALVRSARGDHLEGSVSNLFVIDQETLVTASLETPIVPGVIRGWVLDQARRLALKVTETQGISRQQLESASEVFLTNSVRGIIPVARAEDSQLAPSIDWAAPGYWTERFRTRLAQFVEVRS